VLLEDTALIVSELVTNAIRAGCASGQIDLLIDHDYLRISVMDDAPGGVSLRQAAPEETIGRGLAIVAALARDWGVATSPLGKSVWAEVDFVRPEL
jgi:anti-sigma regulatory factor (Ser/Thr protein kinase)